MHFVNKLKDFVGLGAVDDYEDVDSFDDSHLTTEDPYSSTSSTINLDDSESVTPGFVRPSRRPPFRPEADTSMNSTNNVIGMPRSFTDSPEVVIMEPRSFEEMPQAIQALRDRKTLVLNLSLMDLEQAQRAVDFVAGGTYAIDGHQERVGESIFLFTPNCVKVSSQHGVTHEAPQVHRPSARPASPTPQWGMEDATMMA